MKAQVVVVGSVNADMVVKSAVIPRPGETVTGGRFVMAAGGKGANQAVAAARLGAAVTLVAKVGQDMFGDQAIENYQREGIAVELIVRDAANATGVALIMVDDQGENLISVASGANHALTPADVERARAKITTADIVMLQLEIPLECVACAAQIASESKIPVILNPAPAATLSDELLQQVAYLTPNESEAQRLTGVAVTDEASAEKAAQQLLDRGVQNVIITLGPKGAMIVNRSSTQVVAAHHVQAVDTTAAGDAFNGGLACGLAQGMSLEEAVRFANVVGALSVTKLGAQPSLPTTAEVRAFLESNS